MNHTGRGVSHTNASGEKGAAVLLLCTSFIGCGGTVDGRRLNGSGQSTESSTGGMPSSIASGGTRSTDSSFDSTDSGACLGFPIVVAESAEAATCPALSYVRNAESGCSIPLPQPPAGQVLAAAELQLIYFSGRTSYELPTVESLLSCSGDGGWYPDNSVNPNSLNLCPCTCSLLKSGLLELRFSCPRNGNPQP